jgi:hypothetical protein
LRFRSEQNKNVRSIKDVPIRPSPGRQPGLVGRYRGAASG